MKNTGRFLLPFLLAAAVPAEAQLKGFSLGPYAEAGWLTGNTSATHKTGIGVGFSADIKLPGKLGLTGSAGYMQFASRDMEEGKLPAIKAFPLRAGLKYRALPFIYFKLEGGAAEFSGEEKGSFLLSPGIGFRFLGIDIQGKYETWFRNERISFWGVKAGINF